MTTAYRNSSVDADISLTQEVLPVFCRLLWQFERLEKCMKRKERKKECRMPCKLAASDLWQQYCTWSQHSRDRTKLINLGLKRKKTVQAM